MIRVLVVDDQGLVRAGIRAVLESQPDIDVVGEAADGAAAVEATGRLGPDVVLMDIRMPGLDGIEATRAIRRAHGAARVLVLTTFGHDELLHDALHAGASGFLVKDAPREQLFTAVRAVAAGDELVDASFVRRLVEEFLDRPRPGSGRPERLRDLTERELAVLREVARGRSNAEVAAALFVSEATVRTHVSHLLDKLGLRDRVQLVVAAYETGLVRPGRLGA